MRVESYDLAEQVCAEWPLSGEQRDFSRLAYQVIRHRDRIAELEALLREIDKKVVFETAVMDGSGRDLQERVEAALGIGRVKQPEPPRQ
jgi:hypothetical protein